MFLGLWQIATKMILEVDGDLEVELMFQWGQK